MRSRSDWATGRLIQSPVSKPHPDTKEVTCSKRSSSASMRSERGSFSLPIRARSLPTSCGASKSRAMIRCTQKSANSIAQARASGEVLFASWEIRRRYSQEELEAAEALRVIISSAFEPVGEECGTTYDAEPACPRCGVGRKQTSQLILDVRHVPRVDVTRSLAEEWIVSQRLGELFVDEEITGVRLCHRVFLAVQRLDQSARASTAAARSRARTRNRKGTVDARGIAGSLASAHCCRRDRLSRTTNALRH
jgi:hypothetical protein